MGEMAPCLRSAFPVLHLGCANVYVRASRLAPVVLHSVKGEFLPKSDLSCQIDNICWMEWCPSITKTFLRPTLFQHRALVRCWFHKEKARVVITGLNAPWLVVIVNLLCITMVHMCDIFSADCRSQFENLVTYGDFPYRGTLTCSE